MKDQVKPPLTEDNEKEHSDCKKTPQGRKVTLTKESVKRYRVIVRYIEVTDEERKIKRGIIEDIMRKPYKK